MTVSSLWPGMKVISLSEMNHSSYPKGPPGLFLKSYIILLLTGSPAFNTVMISPLSLSGHVSCANPAMHT